MGLINKIMTTSDLSQLQSGFLFTWKIKNFSFSSKQDNEYVSSPMFRVEMLRGTEWKLLLHTNGKDVVIRILQERINFTPVTILIDIKCVILRADDQHVFSEKNAVLFNGYHSCALLLSTTLDAEEQHMFLPEDTMTVQCHLSNSLSNKLVCCNAITQISMEEYFITFPAYFSGDKNSSNQIITTPLISTSRKYPDFEIVFKSDSKCTVLTVHMKKWETAIYAKFKFVLRDVNGFMNYSFEGEHSFKSGLDHQVWEFSNSTDAENCRLNIVKLGFYTICCHVRMSDNSNISIISNTSFEDSSNFKRNIRKSPFSKSSESLLPANLMKLYLNKKLCDFTIKSNGREFLIHKAVLGTASPVFLAMFERDMHEKETSKVIIDDVDPDTLNKLIEFAYTSHMGNFPWDNTLKLYIAADKYQMEPLKQKCAQVLKLSLALENVCDILIAADLHQDYFLIDASQEFIYENSKEMFRSDHWKIFMENNIELASEVMHITCLRFSSHGK